MAGEPKNVGSYILHVEAQETDNVTGDSLDLTVTVGKASLTVTPGAQTIVYGDRIENSVSKVTAVGLKGSDSLSGIALSTSNSDVTASGVISASNAVVKSGDENVTDNYTITYGTGKLTIEKKNITVTAVDQTITYGQNIQSGVSKVTASGILSGQNLTAVTLTPSTTEATQNGTITPSAAKIMLGSTDVSANYNINYNTGKLVINPAAVTASVEAEQYVLCEVGDFVEPTFTGIDGTVVAGTITYQYGGK